MRRRKQDNTNLVTYTLSTDQGSPDVYVDGIYVGNALYGNLTWTTREYESDKTITLERSTIPISKTGTDVDPQGFRSSYQQPGGIGSWIGTSYFGLSGETTVYSNLVLPYTTYKEEYLPNKLDILKRGNTRITMNAIARKTVTGSGEWIPTFVKEVGTKYNWNGSYYINGNNMTIYYGTNFGGYLYLQFNVKTASWGAGANYQFSFRTSS